MGVAGGADIVAPGLREGAGDVGGGAAHGGKHHQGAEIAATKKNVPGRKCPKK